MRNLRSGLAAGVDQPEFADHFMTFCDRRRKRPSSRKQEIHRTEESLDDLQAPFANGLFLGDRYALAED